MAPLLSLLIWLLPIANQPGWLGHGPLRGDGIHTRVHARSTYSRRQESKVPCRKSSTVVLGERAELGEDETPNFAPPCRSLPSRDLIQLARRSVSIDPADTSPFTAPRPLIPTLRC